MPTYHISVLKHQQRESDKKFPISIRLTHNRKSVYLKTDFYVVKQQLNKSYELKDTKIQRLLFDKIEEYDRLLISKLGNGISAYSAKELTEYIKKWQSVEQGIDFFAFADALVEKMRKNGQTGHAGNFVTSFNALKDFVGKDFCDINDVTSDFLREFEDFLSKERTIVRKDQFGRDREKKCQPLTGTGLHRYLSDIRTVFNQAVDKYNNEDKGDLVIKHNPFKKYKLPEESLPKKKNIPVTTVRRIRDLKDGGGRQDLARDVFMLSFMLAGVNTVDIYKMEYKCLHRGRLTYNRSKTMTRRDDMAEISIRVEPEVLPLIAKYADPDKKRVFNFYRHYTDKGVFNAAVNKGLKSVAAAINDCIDRELPAVKDRKAREDLASEKLSNLVFYAARHSAATIARNQLNISRDDIALFLNHVNEDHRSTDIYIEKDYSRIDSVVRKLLDLLNEG